MSCQQSVEYSPSLVWVWAVFGLIHLPGVVFSAQLEAFRNEKHLGVHAFDPKQEMLAFWHMPSQSSIIQ